MWKCEGCPLEFLYYLSVNAMTQPMMVREDEAPYGD